MRIFQRIKKLKTHQYILGLIFFAGIFFRFYNFPSRYGFDFDASRDALIALYGARELSFPLLGPASALGPFHFGPWYYFQIITFQMIFPFMYAPWIYIALLSLAGIYIGYRIGVELKDNVLGLIVAGFVALSPAQIAPATGLSNPNLVAVPALASVWIFIKLIKEKLSWKWSAAFGFILGVGINNHFQMLPLLLLPAAGLLFTRQNRWLYLLSTAGGLLTSFIPMLVFETSHGFINFRGFLYYILEGRNAVYIPNSWTIYLRDFWPAFLEYVSGLPWWIAGLLFAMSGFYFVRSLVTKALNKSLVILAVIFLIEFVYLRFYSGSRENYYLLYMHPFVFIFLSLGLWYVFRQKYGTYIGSLSIVILLSLNVYSNLNLLHPPESHAEIHALAQFIREETGNKRVMMYDCAERTRFRTMSIVYIYEFDRISDPTETHIGILDHNCDQALKESDLIEERIDMKAFQKKYKNLRYVEVYVLDHTKIRKSGSLGWVKINMNYVYTNNVYKWHR